MTYQLQPARGFLRQYARLQKREREAIDAKLRMLAQNPWHPSLRLKRIRTTDLFEASVNMDIRLVLDFVGDTVIVLLDVGHHDEVLKRSTRR